MSRSASSLSSLSLHMESEAFLSFKNWSHRRNRQIVDNWPLIGIFQGRLISVLFETFLAKPLKMDHIQHLIMDNQFKNLMVPPFDQLLQIKNASDYMSLAIRWLWWPHMEPRISSQYAHQGGLMAPVLTNQRPARGWGDQSEARQLCATIRGRCYAYNGPITGVFLPHTSLSWLRLLHPWIQSAGSGSLSVSAILD